MSKTGPALSVCLSMAGRRVQDNIEEIGFVFRKQRFTWDEDDVHSQCRELSSELSTLIHRNDEPF